MRDFMMAEDDPTMRLVVATAGAVDSLDFTDPASWHLLSVDDNWAVAVTWRIFKPGVFAKRQRPGILVHTATEIPAHMYGLDEGVVLADSLPSTADDYQLYVCKDVPTSIQEYTAANPLSDVIGVPFGIRQERGVPKAYIDLAQLDPGHARRALINLGMVAADVIHNI